MTTRDNKLQIQDCLQEKGSSFSGQTNSRVSLDQYMENLNKHYRHILIMLKRGFQYSKKQLISQFF